MLNGSAGVIEPSVDADGTIVFRCRNAPSTGDTLIPSNLPMETCLVDGISDLIVDIETRIDTDADCDEVLEQTGGGPEICLKRFHDVTVPSDSLIRVSGSRALALVATGSMIVDGFIYARAVLSTSGPGASSLPAGRGEDGQDGRGGGGAGHGSSGGLGGGVVAAGISYGAPTLVPLQGGSSGGASFAVEDGNLQSLPGGGGGGALQLVSCTHLEVRGTIDVSGGGGRGWMELPTPTIGGSGGGSGGGLLIEALDVAVRGTILAFGGGGGGGSTAASSPGGNGSGSSQGISGGIPGGGRGGALNPPGPGEDRSPDGSGGGGGAAGRIRINVRPGTSPDLSGEIAPAPSVGEVGLQGGAAP
jgi:hypothetical protein